VDLAVTCRSESLKLEQISDRLDALGVKRVAIVHEWIQPEIDAYLEVGVMQCMRCWSTAFSCREDLVL